MTEFAAAHHVSTSRRRFLTFGGALILAACLTVLKITMIALDMTEPSDPALMGMSVLQAPTDPPPPPTTLDDSKFVPWPTVTPEPAAGPADDEPESGQIDADNTPTKTIDPKSLTSGQIEALQRLAERSAELDERERLLDMRAEVNGRTEDKLDQQIQRLAALKAELETLMAGLDEEEELKLLRLVKIYETMKPKAAAEIFNRLDMPVLLNVVERMKEAKSAVVLGKMNPAIAQRVTTELAKRKKRPEVGLGS